MQKATSQYGDRILSVGMDGYMQRLLRLYVDGISMVATTLFELSTNCCGNAPRAYVEHRTNIPLPPTHMHETSKCIQMFVGTESTPPKTDDLLKTKRYMQAINSRISDWLMHDTANPSSGWYKMRMISSKITLVLSAPLLSAAIFIENVSSAA